MSGTIVYIRIKSSALSMRNVTEGISFEDVPLIAFSKTSKRLLQIGKAAKSLSNDSDAVVVNGFESPRSIIGDFGAAEKTLQHFLKKVEPQKSWWQFLPFAPTMIIHPLEKVEGGLTQVEARALEDLCYRARAANVYVWTGKILTDAEAKQLQFPQEGKLYNH
ncbi:MAG: rod shape-determining protein [Pyrinomonadaceae bacterium]|nr:rod shape-determining protein [Pyrinomonadaceae bacterium]